MYSARLPDTVPEEDMETADGESGSHSPPPPTELSALKWAFLRHLSLSDNSLTFFPSTCIPYLTSITHLDLSSNLLVSVPPNLSALYHLVSLNLSDNMIDSVLGIYQQLGQVLYVNLARNRLESLCGLERLSALERIDLRHNLIDESAEIGRLAALPNIQEIWVDGNPLVEFEEGYRVTCFEYFQKEGKTVSLDGSAPGFYEKRNLSVPPPAQMFSSRPVSAAYSPPVVAVGHAHAHGSTSPASHSSEASPNLAAVGVVTSKPRRKLKRIVDLDAGDSDGGGGLSRGTSHIRTQSDGSSSRVKVQAVDPVSLQIPSNSGWSQFGALAEEGAHLSASSNVGTMPRRPRHTRHQTEASPTAIEPAVDSPMAPSSYRQTRNSATLSSKSAARRKRVTASVFEPGTTLPEGEGEPEDSVELYRQRIEALKKDMGDGWLKVFRQSS
ncbi:unnamed protein product [Mycena citricolor]|uniref:Uncharacterized protein n=1 Tax=Mycena citricolor TaxID=2018698 RepID=A0AAD2K694_9AGAR|nr:unnamed protein product [Mycena citricolor]